MHADVSRCAKPLVKKADGGVKEKGWKEKGCDITEDSRAICMQMASVKGRQESQKMVLKKWEERGSF